MLSLPLVGLPVPVSFRVELLRLRSRLDPDAQAASVSESVRVDTTGMAVRWQCHLGSGQVRSESGLLLGRSLGPWLTESPSSTKTRSEDHVSGH